MTKPTRAAAALAEVVRHQPRAPPSCRRKLARLYRKRGEHDLAIRQLTRLLSRPRR